MKIVKHVIFGFILSFQFLISGCNKNSADNMNGQWVTPNLTLSMEKFNLVPDLKYFEFRMVARSFDSEIDHNRYTVKAQLDKSTYEQLPEDVKDKISTARSSNDLFDLASDFKYSCMYGACPSFEYAVLAYKNGDVQVIYSRELKPESTLGVIDTDSEALLYIKYFKSMGVNSITKTENGYQFVNSYEATCSQPTLLRTYELNVDSYEINKINEVETDQVGFCY